MLDSLLGLRVEQIRNLQDQVKGHEEMDKIKQDRIDRQEEKIQDLSNEVARCRKRSKVKSVIFTSVGSFVGFLVSYLLK